MVINIKYKRKNKVKFKTWTCGFFAGLIATTVLTAISLTLHFSGIIPISITEYGARFILHIPDKPMHLGRWIVGFITNYSLGGLFGILSTYLYKATGPEEKLIKLSGIAFCMWFFQLAIVPFLDHTMDKYSTYDTALAYYLIYLIWSYIATTFIIRYFDFPDKDSAMTK
ncbi:MAG: hypothetical protein JM58_09090 [Peptococcaceae bacterium BICA1-8]|nr:MAG: hypothetical protein JM58_09090 [Peptococcaceae bacterium BICA1-8]